MKKVDIIVPIYNAYEYTVECINSVIKYTDLDNNSLILINDKSPDNAILPMLKEYISNKGLKNIILIDNDKNLGFVGTVNVGMKYSKNDVVLLNSDTEVTNNWLEKISACAYSDESIATITPFTNNGTICSIPNFGVDNELPQNMNLTQYANMVEKVSLKKYPDITTGVGFCMYIKRDVIDKIGYFDEESFGKGYGEENDFCYRALDYGYRNVLCDDTFIYHKGTQSFTESQKKRSEEHMEILKKRYPIYVQKTDNFIRENPLKMFQEIIKIGINTFEKKNILYLIHEWDTDNKKLKGGTSHHLFDIIKGVGNELNCFVLCPLETDASTYRLYVYSNNGISTYDYKIFKGYNNLVFHSTGYKEMLNNIIKAYSIDIIHIQHLINHTFDAIDCAKENNLYSIITLHDFYMICPTVNMLYKYRYCNSLEKKDCSNCLYSRYGISNNILDIWKVECKNFLSKFDVIITPSENTRKLYLESYPNIMIRTIPHGVNLELYDNGANLSNELNVKKKSDTFNIAFIGVMTKHKGSDIVRDVISNDNLKNIKFHLFGRSEDKTLEKSTNNYKFHGGYVREELPSILTKNNIDLICIFSTWPETYSYTLTEAIIAKIPVLSYNLGAVNDRITENEIGWTVEYKQNISNIIEKIKNIIKNKDDYNLKKLNISNIKIKTVKEMNNEYLQIYSNSIVERKYNSQDAIIRLEQVNNFLYSKEFSNYINRYGFLIHKYEKLRNTKIWRLSKKIKRRLLRIFGK